MDNTKKVIELLEKAEVEAGDINFEEFPGHNQKCQSLIQQVLALLKEQPASEQKEFTKKARELLEDSTEFGAHGDDADNLRDSLKQACDEIDRLTAKVEQSKNYSPYSSFGCSLCEWEHGKRVKLCGHCETEQGLRNRIERLQAELAEAKNKIILLQAERDGLCSLLLDVQQDCIGKQKQITELEKETK